MTRGDIGSHLGLKLETVSRLICKFHRRGLIELGRRQVRIPDLSALERVRDASSAPAQRALPLGAPGAGGPAAASFV